MVGYSMTRTIGQVYGEQTQRIKFHVTASLQCVSVNQKRKIQEMLAGSPQILMGLLRKHRY